MPNNDESQGIQVSRASTIIVTMVLVLVGVRILAGMEQHMGCGASFPAATIQSIRHLGAEPSFGECFVIALQQPDRSVVSGDDPTAPEIGPVEPVVAPGDEAGCRDYATRASAPDLPEQQVFAECMTYGAP